MRGALVLALVAVAACDAASSDPGAEARLQVAGAQWRPGPAPRAAGGPAIVSVASQRPTIVRDTTGQRLSGVLDASATAVWLGLDGDAGGWIVGAGLPSADVPDLPSFTAAVALAADAPLGAVTLRLIAVDAAARPGAATTLALVADDAPPPAGALVVTLGWDGAADLDLHVVAPDGGEAWSGDPNTYESPPPGSPIDPDAWRQGGLLDHDGNHACRRDGRPREDVIWSVPPPAGHYVVRVDAPDLCGAAAAYFHVEAYRGGALLGAVTGSATPDDVALPHGAGAGTTVLELDLP